MDPNANLIELRALIADNIDSEFVSDHVSARIIELVDALDGWLSEGGFLPDAWQRNRPVCDEAEGAFTLIPQGGDTLTYTRV